MTKTKAFFICFIVPLALVGFFSLMILSNPPNGGFNMGLGLLLMFVGLLVPISLFVVPVYIGRRWGTELRKYGLYGALVAGFLIGSLLNLAYYKII